MHVWEELQQFHNEDNLLLGFVNMNGLKEEGRKEKIYDSLAH